MNYRADVVGLRALAVVAIVAFHLGVSTLSAGFIGVDIFYVISGFLIGASSHESLRKALSRSGASISAG
jgi:peptidoglycan/LPS O-acetylase OafA/YrhL